MVIFPFLPLASPFFFFASFYFFLLSLSRLLSSPCGVSLALSARPLPPFSAISFVQPTCLFGRPTRGMRCPATLQFAQNQDTSLVVRDADLKIVARNARKKSRAAPPPSSNVLLPVSVFFLIVGGAGFGHLAVKSLAGVGQYEAAPKLHLHSAVALRNTPLPALGAPPAPSAALPPAASGAPPAPQF
eukprot:GHVT01049464.1.p1 GENE.GHVT01049464.1~~GHVT01049464.1.p1  ORF type:complete len:187 (+),score=41.51 GHVT01049464.1:1127-1687(+)